MRTLIFVIPAIVLLLGCISAPADNATVPAPPANETGNASPPPTCAQGCTKELRPVCGIDLKTYPNSCQAGCAGAAVLHEGECALCEDSDGGVALRSKGTVTGEGISGTDVCAGAGAVEEYYCENGRGAMQTAECPEGSDCADGACVERASQESSCTDTDEKDVYTKGTVNGVFSDTCNDATLVKEYYCQDGLPQNELLQCPPGFRCEGGLCARLEKTCTDSDGGNDTGKAGTVSVVTILSQNKYQDRCKNASVVEEYYCAGSEQAKAEFECPSDSYCSLGECVEDACEDSDLGYDIYVKGETGKGSDSFEDYCKGSNNGIEYQCDDNEIVSDPFSCPPGYECTNGRCVEG